MRRFPAMLVTAMLVMTGLVASRIDTEFHPLCRISLSGAVGCSVGSSKHPERPSRIIVACWSFGGRMLVVTNEWRWATIVNDDWPNWYPPIDRGGRQP